MHNLSFEQKLDKLSGKTKTLFFGDFIGNIIAEKMQKGHVFSINICGDCESIELAVYPEIETEKYAELIHEDTTFIDTDLILRDIKNTMTDTVNECYDNEIVLRGCPYAIRGLSPADFH